MEKILFSTHCNTQTHIEISKAILKILLSKGYSIGVIANCDLNLETGNQVFWVQKEPEADYDVIFAFNAKGHRKIKQLAKKKQIPVVYIVCREDCEKEYLYDLSQASRFLIINDGIELNQLLFPEEYTMHINFPFVPEKKGAAANITSDAPILVATDERTLLKTIPILNNHGEYRFVIVSNTPAVKQKLLNSNCEVVSAKHCRIVDYIARTSLVIGSGAVILKSIGYNKPVIVVGKYGFGRRVTMDNIELHFSAMFKGRPGAQGEEIIPFNLLSHEIVSCMNQPWEEKEKACTTLSHFLVEKYEQTSSRIDSLINTVHTSTNILDTPLKLSGLYAFIALDETSYIAVDSRWMKIHAMVDCADYHLIQLFKVGATPSNVMAHITHKNEKQFVDFIKYLISYKFLIPYEKSTDQ